MCTITRITILGMALMTFTLAQAVPLVSLYTPANVGIGSIDVIYEDAIKTITITENWTSVDPGYLIISGLDEFQAYTFKKVIYNNTGKDWASLANELLAPKQGSPGNDYVPAGFTTSSDFDGLSFAQKSTILRTSNVFLSVLEDEWSTRDFLDFTDGTLLNGGSDTISYGLRLNIARNQPFLLAQRPNKFSEEPPQIPEPVSLTLLGIGLGGLVLQRYRQRRS